MSATPHSKYAPKTQPVKRGSGGLQNMTKEARARADLRRFTPIEVRFWWDVDKNGPGGCWLWLGTIETGGHGRVSVRNRDRRAHHVSLELAGQNPMIEGHVVDHICRVRHCVNPDHLRIVPERVNSLENNLSPSAVHARKTHCLRGHPLSGENLALYKPKRRKTRHGNFFECRHPTRVCLTCRPSYWRWAVIPRERPPGSRRLKRDEI